MNIDAINWVVQECWREITEAQPRTRAWLQRDDQRPDTISWEDVLKAVDVLKEYRWIDYLSKGKSLTPDLYTSVNEIWFTTKAEADIRGQIEDNPDLPIRFTG